MNKTIVEKMNLLGKERTPFFFMVDYKGEEGMVIPISELDSSKIRYDFNGVSNVSGDNDPKSSVHKVDLKSYPLTITSFQKSFDTVKDGLLYGDSFLTNLTMKTPIKISIGLEEIFDRAHAKYRLLLEDQFVCFSPEIFVQIKDGKIASFPMKGTIDATLPNAEEKILNDYKETSEHFTIVDLIRNDLSSVASKVRVKKIRYIDHLKTQKGELLQVSSHIEGSLSDDYHKNLGTIFSKLLPAGSITGAPKKKTCEIIERAEPSQRGYYTGVAGIYDGTNLDSMVMIRFIAKEADRYFFHSGGGITAMSDVKSEYQELIDKIYVPIY